MEPKSFWGKLTVVTAFLSALGGLGVTLNQCTNNDDFTSRVEYMPPQATPLYDPSEAALYDLPQTSQRFIPQIQLGNYCCDGYGIRWCALDITGARPIGSPCLCMLQGTGVVCQ